MNGAATARALGLRTRCEDHHTSLYECTARHSSHPAQRHQACQTCQAWHATLLALLASSLNSQNPRSHPSIHPCRPPRPARARSDAAKHCGGAQRQRTLPARPCAQSRLPNALPRLARAVLSCELLREGLRWARPGPAWAAWLAGLLDRGCIPRGSRIKDVARSQRARSPQQNNTARALPHEEAAPRSLRRTPSPTREQSR